MGVVRFECDLGSNDVRFFNFVYVVCGGIVEVDVVNEFIVQIYDKYKFVLFGEFVLLVGLF